MIHVHLRRKYILLLDTIFCTGSFVRLIWSMVLFKSKASLLISCLADASVVEDGVLMSPTITLLLFLLLVLLVLLCIFRCSTVEHIKHLQLLYLLDGLTPLTLYNNLLCLFKKYPLKCKDDSYLVSHLTKGL